MLASLPCRRNWLALSSPETDAKAIVYYVHVGASAILDLGLQSRVMRRMHVIDAGTRFVVMLLAGPPCHRN